MNTWLITGGAGFIGSNFLRLAHQRTDAMLIILDLLTYAGDLARIADLLPSQRIEFFKGDICDTHLVDTIFMEKRISKVIHFAAESHVDRSILKPDQFLKTNVEGTFNLLKAAGKFWHNEENNLFLHISTDEVYGSLGQDQSSFSEISPYRPSSPYSASKASSDHLVRVWYQTYGLPTIITNCSNNYGPWQYPEKLIPFMILNALEGKALPVYGDGLQIRDWLHVQDHCEALLAVLQHGALGETYNIGGNNEKTNIDIVHTICDLVDIFLNNRTGSSRNLIRHIKDRLGHDRRYAINSSKIQKELGWKPRKNDFKSSLYETVLWYINNKLWAKEVNSRSLDFFNIQYNTI